MAGHKDHNELNAIEYSKRCDVNTLVGFLSVAACCWAGELPPLPRCPAEKPPALPVIRIGVPSRANDTGPVTIVIPKAPTRSEPVVIKIPHGPPLSRPVVISVRRPFQRDPDIALGYPMLIAFAGDRDYDTALRLARRIVEEQPKSIFVEIANRFIEELPKRKEDFKTLKLPTPAEWEELKKTFSRAEQIDYLCRRLRLVNTFSSRLGYAITSQQYVEPPGMDANAANSLRRGETELINPALELFGQINLPSLRKQPGFDGMNLRVGDLPYIVPHLRDDWSLLIVEFWREGVPRRNVARVRIALAWSINAIARHELIDLKQFEALSPEEREKDIARMIAWAREHVGKTEAEIEIIGLAIDLQRGKRWDEVRSRHLADGRIARIAAQYLRHPDAEVRRRTSSSMVVALESDKDAAKTAIPLLLDLLEKGDDDALRLRAALLLLQARETERTVPLLGNLLEKASANALGRNAWYAVHALLAEQTPRARAAARRILRNPFMEWPTVVTPPNRAQLVHLLADAGMPDGYRIYLKLLDSKATSFDRLTHGRPIAELVAEELIRQSPAYHAVTHFRDIQNVEQRRLAIKKWLETQLETDKK